MGWDVVQIGLKHDLPVDDPIATAEQVAKRTQCNVRLVYRNKYEYDNVNNIVSKVEKWEYIEIAQITIDSSKDYLQMIISNYQVNQILKETDINTLRKAKYTSDDATLLLDDIQNQFELYVINDENLSIRIFHENIDLNALYYGWWPWENLFHPEYYDIDELHDSRMQIYERARMFGCKEVIICSDQGPTIKIWDRMDYSAEQLKHYMFSNQFYEEPSWYKPEEMESWKKHAKKITFSSVFQDDFKLEGEDFVELVYDDFKDLNLRECL